MKMKIVWAVLFPVSLLAVPLFVSAVAHSAGTNVLNNGTIYMVTTDGQLRPYTSAGAYLSYGFNSWNNVIQANSDDLALPTGNFIPPRDGTIICSDRGNDKETCYLITNGQKAGFTSEDVFNKSGFNFKYALSGDVSFLPAAANISSSTQAHLPGTLINDSGTVKLVGTNGTIGVPSMDTLQSWGYSLVNVVNSNTADQALPQTDILTPHTAGQLAYNTTTNNPVSPTPTFNPIPTSSPTSTPTFTPTSTPALTDVCKNIEGSQTFIPLGLVSDSVGNCIVPTTIPNPTPSPTTIPTPSPTTVPQSDTIAPKLNKILYWNGSFNNDLRYDGSAYDGHLQYQWEQAGHPMGGYRISFESNEPVTAKLKLLPLTDSTGQVLPEYGGKDFSQLGPIFKSEENSAIVITDNNLSSFHSFVYQDLPIERGVEYVFNIEITDASGNVFHQISEQGYEWMSPERIKLKPVCTGNNLNDCNNN